MFAFFRSFMEKTNEMKQPITRNKAVPFLTPELIGLLTFYPGTCKQGKATICGM